MSFNRFLVMIGTPLVFKVFFNAFSNPKSLLAKLFFNTLICLGIVTGKRLKDIETQAMIDKWQEELARHVAYLPILCEQAGVDEHELHRAIEIHFYVRSMSKGAMQ